MLQFALDTDHLTLYDHGHPPLKRHLATRTAGVVGLTVVTVEECLRGRLAALVRARDGAARIARYDLLTHSPRQFQRFPLVAFDQPVEDQFQQLIRLRLRIGARDLRIAACALANKLTLVT